jgi:hypothetical protein
MGRMYNLLLLLTLLEISTLVSSLVPMMDELGAIYPILSSPRTIRGFVELIYI